MLQQGLVIKNKTVGPRDQIFYEVIRECPEGFGRKFLRRFKVKAVHVPFLESARFHFCINEVMNVAMPLITLDILH